MERVSPFSAGLRPEVVKRALATLSELPEATRRSSCGCHVRCNDPEMIANASHGGLECKSSHRE
jgi:hypothetical protein